jgi:hypothetical protein
MAGRSKKVAQRHDHILDGTPERGETATVILDRQVLHPKDILPNVLSHQDAADLPIASSRERQD